MSNPSRETEVAPRVALSDEQSDITHAAACARGARIERRFRGCYANFNWEFACSDGARSLFRLNRVIGACIASLPYGGNGFGPDQQTFKVIQIDVEGFSAFGNGFADILTQQSCGC